MSDRSEVTESRDSRSTEDLLSETDDLLSGTGGERSSEPAAEREPDQTPPDTEDDSPWWRSGGSADEEATADAESDDSSRLAGLRPNASASEYFSPKAFLAVVLLIGTGLIVGEMLLPFGGQVAGMFAIAFAIGLLTTKRRYLELATAGLSVGATAALLGNAVLVAAGSATTIVAIGATAGVLASIGGYYFGRDLRNGLARDIE